MGKVIVAGGSGFIGTALLRLLRDSGHEVVVLSRSSKEIEGAKVVQWDGKSQGNWTKELEGAKAVVNLSGSPIEEAWTPQTRARIVSSRVDPTLSIGEAISRCSDPPPYWLNSSAVGYYGDRGNERLTESSRPGKDFLGEVCQEWESATRRHALPATKVGIIRTGIVLGRDGFLEPLVNLTKLFLGGSIGSGSQYISWIHIEDIVSMMLHCIGSRFEGPMNGVAPKPVLNRQFMATLREVLGRPPAPPAPGFLVGLGARLVGKEGSLLLQGQRAFPEAAQRAGYKFKFSHLKPALENLLG